jgi:hypothetical protein
MGAFFSQGADLHFPGDGEALAGAVDVKIFRRFAGGVDVGQGRQIVGGHGADLHVWKDSGVDWGLPNENGVGFEAFVNLDFLKMWRDTASKLAGYTGRREWKSWCDRIGCAQSFFDGFGVGLFACAGCFALWVFR